MIGGTGRTFSNDESTAAAGRIDNPAGDDAANDALHGGDGLGGVASDDDDVIAGDNATDRPRRAAPSAPREPSSTGCPSTARGARRPGTSRTSSGSCGCSTSRRPADTAPETNGDERRRHDQRRGERGRDLRPGRRRHDQGRRRRSRRGRSAATPAADDYIEGNGGADTDPRRTSVRTTSPAAARRAHRQSSTRTATARSIRRARARRCVTATT